MTHVCDSCVWVFLSVTLAIESLDLDSEPYTCVLCPCVTLARLSQLGQLCACVSWSMNHIHVCASSVSYMAIGLYRLSPIYDTFGSE